MEDFSPQKSLSNETKLKKKKEEEKVKHQKEGGEENICSWDLCSEKGWQTCTCDKRNEINEAQDEQLNY